jgi:hypothetical protein
MPGLALIAEELGDRVGFLTIMTNFERDRDRAIEITESANAPFLTVDFNDFTNILRRHITSSYIPQVFIYDGDGNVIENIVGGDADEYREAIINALIAGG